MKSRAVVPSEIKNRILRSNGEVIALLVVAPSKTERERVIPMSAELFHAIACVIRRITLGHKSVPLATRYDDYERTTSHPQPFLFQRRIGQRREVMTTGTIGTSLRSVCKDLAETDPRFAGIRFRPHDFRRLFATDLVNNGLPIHIGAALLGHLDLNTTRGYVAVFEEDVTRHYQAHLQRRRELRPDEEYRPVTDQEWAEFQEHFDKRKVELGSCGRPYATPCSHEHACIRCPMLHVDPRMIHRLNDIETDLEHEERWLGEIEGIDLTLVFLRRKRDEANRLVNRTTARDPRIPEPLSARPQPELQSLPSRVRSTRPLTFRSARYAVRARAVEDVGGLERLARGMADDEVAIGRVWSRRGGPLFLAGPPPGFAGFGLGVSGAPLIGCDTGPDTVDVGTTAGPGGFAAGAASDR